MKYIPPYAALQIWMARVAVPGSRRLAPAYDDVLDVLKKILGSVAVDEDWYKAEYPAVSNYLKGAQTETAASHFHKHGYFEGRKPFAPGWRGRTAPVPFAVSCASLRITPIRGRLQVDIARDEFLGLVKNILIAVPVDEVWYRAAYPAPAKEIDGGKFASAADHFIKQGYADGCLPFEIVVDEKWYVTRYRHVRTGLERGVASSVQDHFMRVGYHEGCRPAPP
jgi:hypothetical protein